MILKIVLIALVVLVAAGYCAYLYIDNNQRRMVRATIPDVDLSRVPDGTYPGACDVFPVSVEVRVAVKDHRICGIEIVKHRNGKGASAESIVTRVMNAQSLNVDVVSGATISSKVILKAVANALEGAK
jgi:uncharacterized protein with FMN-binding domain